MPRRWSTSGPTSRFTPTTMTPAAKTPTGRTEITGVPTVRARAQAAATIQPADGPVAAEPMGKDRLRHRMIAAGAAAGGRREVGDPDGAQVAVGIDAAAERDLERRGAHRRPDDRDADGGGDARRLREERAAVDGQRLPVEQRPEQAVAAEGAEEQPRLARRIDAGSRKGEGHVEQPAGQHEPEREDDRPAEAPGQHADRQRGEQPRRPADRIAGVEEEIAGCRVEAAGRAPCRAPR